MKTCVFRSRKKSCNSTHSFTQIFILLSPSKREQVQIRHFALLYKQRLETIKMAPKQTDETKKECIQQLRQLIANDTDDAYFKSDAYLLTWLEDKKFKVEKAEKALRESLQWRKENRIDSVLSEEFDESWLPTKYEFLGNDKVGRPIILSYSKIGEVTEEIFVKAMERALADLDTTRRYGFFMAEKVGAAIRESAKVSNNPINSIVAIVDMESVKFTGYTKYVTKLLPVARQNQAIFEANYPGILHELIVVNARKKPLRLLLAMLKPLLQSEIYSKIHIYGHKSEKWIPVLLEKIDASVLPKRYGGTRDDDVLVG